MREEGETLQRIQTIMRGMASDMEAGNLPDVLRDIKNKAQVDAVWTASGDTYPNPESQNPWVIETKIYY